MFCSISAVMAFSLAWVWCNQIPKQAGMGIWERNVGNKLEACINEFK